MDDAKKWFEETVINSGQVQQIKEQVNSTTDEALVHVKRGIAMMEAATSEQVHEAKSLAKQVSEKYADVERVFFHHLKEGVEYATANPGYTTGAAAVLVAFSYRGPRRFFYRNTIGRLTSEEAQILSAEAKVKDFSSSVESYKADNLKLQERAAAAQDEFLSGQRKMRTTAAELQRLWKTVNTREERMKGFRESLRELPARESLRLRSEAANVAADARRVRSELGKKITAFARYGIGA